MSGIAEVGWPRRTERLSLRPGTEADLEAMWRIRRQESVARWMTELAPSLEFFLDRSRELDRLASTLVYELDGRLIGDLMLRVEDAWGQGEVKDQVRGVQAEIGWCLDPELEGNGYATEAVTELITVAFEGLGLRRLTANCFADNEPSWRLMERVGMRREAYHVRDALHRSGQWLDGMVYALLAEEWTALRGS